jgi:prolipoprotein diacylglyceryltransferase
MEFPVTFGIFKTAEPLHYIFETLAFVIGIRVYFYNRKKINDPISDVDRYKILLGCMIGALLGSRIIAVFENPSTLHQLSLLTLFHNKTIAGGFFGGLFGVEITKKIIGIKIATGDIYVIPILIAIFIGRIGCFLMGVSESTHGIETTFFTGMNLGDGKLRHPVALYEIIFAVLLLLFFELIKNKALQNGDRFKLFMVMYFLYRFSVEFIKPYESLFIGLSIIQLISLIIFAYYWKYLMRIFTLKFS